MVVRSTERCQDKEGDGQFAGMCGDVYKVELGCTKSWISPGGSDTQCGGLEEQLPTQGYLLPFLRGWRILPVLPLPLTHCSGACGLASHQEQRMGTTNTSILLRLVTGGHFQKGASLQPSCRMCSGSHELPSPCSFPLTTSPKTELITILPNAGGHSVHMLRTRLHSVACGTKNL
jgi:hypothetical protein